MVDYNSAKTTATRLLSENGRAVTIISNGPNTGTAWNPEYGAAVQTPVTAVVTKYKTNEIDGTIIRKEDKKMLIDADDIQAAIDAGGPIETQKIKDGDTEYSIIDVEEIKPGPVSILSKVQCRV